MKKLTQLEFDQMLVLYYSNKIRSCKDRGIEFNLTLTQVKNMLRAKRCQYTGVLLTRTPGQNKLPTDVTIERIDPSKPYETGNVCAISHAANSARAAFDAVYRGDSAEMMIKMA